MGGRRRFSWDEYFMLSALLAAGRSSCRHLRTGAVIVRDKRIIAVGYNGAPSGIENCLERGCRKEEIGESFEKKNTGNCRGIHAEKNALAQISRELLIGTTLYTLYFPCSICAKEIVGGGIRQVVYSRLYDEPNSLTNELFAEAGVVLRRFELDLKRYFAVLGDVFERHVSF